MGAFFKDEKIQQKDKESLASSMQADISVLSKALSELHANIKIARIEETKAAKAASDQQKVVDDLKNKEVEINKEIDANRKQLESEGSALETSKREHAQKVKTETEAILKAKEGWSKEQEDKRVQLLLLDEKITAKKGEYDKVVIAHSDLDLKHSALKIEHNTTIGKVNDLKVQFDKDTDMHKKSNSSAKAELSEINRQIESERAKIELPTKNLAEREAAFNAKEKDAKIQRIRIERMWEQMFPGKTLKL